MCTRTFTRVKSNNGHDSKILKTIRMYINLEWINHSGIFNKTEKNKIKPHALIALIPRSIIWSEGSLSEKINTT